MQLPSGFQQQQQQQQMVNASSSSSKHQRGYSTHESGPYGGSGGGPSSVGGGGGGNAGDMAKNFKVVVRIRPPLPRELEGRGSGGSGGGYRDIVRTDSDHRAITICEGGFGGTRDPVTGALVPSPYADSSISYPSHKFTFDYVYDQDAQQEDVYAHTAREAVLSTLQGYNGQLSPPDILRLDKRTALC
jgi:hypothetical protein